VAALLYLALVVLAAVIAPIITPYDPNRIEMGATLLPPSVKHWLGTDESGRDEFTRLLYGARISLTIGVAAMLLSVILGSAIGALAGFFGGLVDGLTMRLTDAMLSIPIFFFLLTVLAVFGSAVPTMIIAIALSSWMTAARVVRAEVLRTVNLDFVAAARALGAGNWRTVLLHLLPSAVPSMMVASTIGVGQAILTESALSYLGADRLVGEHAEQRPELLFFRSIPGHLAGHDDPVHGAQLQFHRRLGARHPQSISELRCRQFQMTKSQ
jgi:peptide/nickel transport system permease protein